MRKYNNFTNKDLTMVICAYGECEYLEDCVQSVVNQKRRVEVVISTSTPNDHIKSIAKKYHIKVCVNKDGGQVKDYNFAMNQGQGRLVMLMHQDEIIKPEFSEYIIKAANRSKKPIIIFTDYIEMHNDIVDKKPSLMVRIKRMMLLPAMIKPVYWKGKGKRFIQLLGNPITHPTVVCVRNEMPERIFDERFKASMDWDLWERLSRQKGSFVYVPKVLLYHRMNDANQTAQLLSSNNARYNEELEIFSRFWPSWFAKFIMKFYKLAYKYY